MTDGDALDDCFKEVLRLLEDFGPSVSLRVPSELENVGCVSVGLGVGFAYVG